MSSSLVTAFVSRRVLKKKPCHDVVLDFQHPPFVHYCLGFVVVSAFGGVSKNTPSLLLSVTFLLAPVDVLHDRLLGLPRSSRCHLLQWNYRYSFTVLDAFKVVTGSSMVKVLVFSMDKSINVLNMLALRYVVVTI